MALTTELASRLSEAVVKEDKAPLTFEEGETGVLLKWKTGRAHEIHVVGITKPSQLRHLLEFGLRHIRACIHRGRPLNSEAQVANHKQGEI